MGFLSNLLGGNPAGKALKAHNDGKYEEAMRLYEEAVQKGSRDYRLLNGYSVLLIRTSQFDKALEVIKQIEKLPKLTDKQKASYRINYSIILAGKGHLDRALEILENEFEHTKNSTLYSIIGFLKIEKGDADEALAFNQKAIEYDDEDPVFLENMGQVYYRLLGDKEAAKPYFEKALQFKPSAIDTNYFLALYDIEAGDLNSAKDKLEISRKGFTSPLNYATPKMIAEKIEEINR